MQHICFNGKKTDHGIEFEKVFTILKRSQTLQD